MGVLYIITPLTDEVTDWLAESGVSFREDTASRLPLLSEIRDVLDSLAGFSVEYTDNGIGSSWQAMVSTTADPESSEWTMMNISHRKDPAEPQEIWFEKGFPELIV